MYFLVKIYGNPEYLKNFDIKTNVCRGHWRLRSKMERALSVYHAKGECAFC